MKVVIIKNYDTGEEIIRFKTAKLRNLFADLDYSISKVKDPLGLGGNYTVRCGIKSFSEQDLVMTNDPFRLKGNEDICMTGPNTTVFGNGSSRHQTPPDPVLVFNENGGKTLDLRLAVTAYPEGYVLNTGKMGTNFLGGRKQVYLSTIGKRNFKFSAKTGAHIFSTIEAMLSYCEKHQKELEYMVSYYGYDFSIEPTCDLFAESLDDIPAKDRPFLPELQSMLDQINHTVSEANEPEENLSGTATPEEMKAEAVKRLRMLGVMENPVIRDFQTSGKIYRSESGGILYDLDEQAQEAVDVFQKEWNYLPYAVIVSYTEIGTMYTVLFVSPNKEEWPGERPDTRDGFCYAYVYNADDPMLSELGGVLVEGANGGLCRVA